MSAHINAYSYRHHGRSTWSIFLTPNWMKQSIFKRDFLDCHTDKWHLLCWRNETVGQQTQWKILHFICCFTLPPSKPAFGSDPQCPQYLLWQSTVSTASYLILDKSQVCCELSFRADWNFARVSREKTEPVCVLNRWVQGLGAGVPGGGADSETGWGSCLRRGGEGRRAMMPWRRQQQQTAGAVWCTRSLVWSGPESSVEPDESETKKNKLQSGFMLSSRKPEKKR